MDIVFDIQFEWIMIIFIQINYMKVCFRQLISITGNVLLSCQFVFFKSTNIFLPLESKLFHRYETQPANNCIYNWYCTLKLCLIFDKICTIHQHEKWRSRLTESNKITIPFCPKFEAVCFQYCTIWIRIHFGKCF